MTPASDPYFTMGYFKIVDSVQGLNHIKLMAWSSKLIVKRISIFRI